MRSMSILRVAWSFFCGEAAAVERLTAGDTRVLLASAPEIGVEDRIGSPAIRKKRIAGFIMESFAEHSFDEYVTVPTTRVGVGTNYMPDHSSSN